MWFINLVEVELRCQPRLTAGQLQPLLATEEPAAADASFALPPFGVRVWELKSLP